MNTRSRVAVTTGASVGISPSSSTLLEPAARFARGASAVPRRTCMETLNLDALRNRCYRHRALCRQIARGSERHSARTFTRTIGTQPRAWAGAANSTGWGICPIDAPPNLWLEYAPPRQYPRAVGLR